MTTTTQTLSVDGLGAVAVTLTAAGSGRPVLLLHGGAGPISVAGFGQLLSSEKTARVLVPVHPGFDGTPRPDQLTSVASLAAVYAQLLRDLDLNDVCVIGNSVGGWIAAELALAESAAPDCRVSALVIIDAAGLQVEAAPIPDFFSLTLDQVFDLSYFNPDAFRIDPSALSDERKTAQAANRAALLVYGGRTMGDPTLAGRLAGIRIPTLVIWGTADRMIPIEHGHAYADAIPGAELQLITEAGHLPQLEAPAKLLAAVWDFASSDTAAPTTEAGTASMKNISIVGPGEGEVALAGPTELRILEDGTTTSHRLGVAEITIAPHTAGPPQHRHARHDEGFYVVSGTVQFTVGDATYEAGPRTLVIVPPGAPHTFANTGNEPVIMLNTFTPDEYVQYFRDLRDMIAAGQPMTGDAIQTVMARYGTEAATTFAI